ncbi:MAG: S-layer homology domain-containing protein [Clostridia bacterium]|nr:S-layer homology domain-containing protein [Clostridia bacterium]
MPSFSGYIPLNDVPSNHWAREAVEYMYNSGIMKGTSDTTFGGKIVVTRAMFVTMMAAVSNADLGSSDVSVFKDVAKDKYYTAAANWAYENDLASGNENGEFMPNSPLTREQCYVMLRALGEYMNYDVTYEDPTILSLYHDSSSASSYSKSALAWACNFGLASGGDDYTIMPKKTATRYEIAMIVYRFMDYTNTPPIEPPVTHNVTFKNWDGVLLYSAVVKHGESAVYRGSTPVRMANEDYTFTFDGWDKSLSNVTDDIVYIAKFKAVPIPKYKVEFRNWDGTLLYTTYVKYGKPAYYVGQSPTKPSDSSFNYVFSGWDKQSASITADTVIYAVFAASPINYIRSIYDDVFGYGITINGSDFRMSQSLSNRLNSTLQNSGRTVGFYVVDLTNNVTLGYNAQKKFKLLLP